MSLAHTRCLVASMRQPYMRQPYMAILSSVFKSCTSPVCVKLHLLVTCIASTVTPVSSRQSAGMSPDHSNEHHAEALTHSAIVIQSKYRGHKCR